jgi:hypothetical protein
MDEKKANMRQALRGVHIAILLTLLIIWGFTIYNYIDSGRIHFTAILWSIILLVVLIVQRLSLKDKGNSK